MAKIDNLIIDSIVSLSGFELATGDLLFQMNQLQDATINGTSEAIDVNGARGQVIASLDRTKGLSIECTNGLFVINAFASQVGANVQEADVGSPIETPYIEQVKVGKDNTATLSHTAKVGTTQVYKMSRTGGKGEKLTLAADSVTKGQYMVEGKTVTIAAEEEFEGEKALIVVYTFDANNGIKIVNDSETFTKEIRLLASILCRDVCDSTLYYTIMDMPRAKIDGNFSLTMGNEAGTHPLTATAMPNLCSADKTFFDWYIVSDDDK